MRCQHCGNRISLLRKLKDSEFCSDEHRDFYAIQQQQMAVSRLMETSSPKHKPLPGLKKEGSNSGRALPKGADRRAIPASQAEAGSGSKPRHAPPETPTPVAPPAVLRTAPLAPPPAPAVAGPRTSVAPASAVASPVYRVATRMCGAVSEEIRLRDWAPKRWHRVAPESMDFSLTLASPVTERPLRSRMGLGRMLPISESHTWGSRGSFVVSAFSEDPAPSAAPSTFSEIQSLSMNGFIGDRRLTLDTTPYAAPAPEEAAPEPEEFVPGFQPRIAVSAEGALGASQVPRAQAGPIGVPLGEAAPLEKAVDVVPPVAAPPVRLALLGELPAIDLTVESLENIAARHEPGLVRLRSPRQRSPLPARLVKPAAGSSGPPIRVRPAVRPPQPQSVNWTAVMPAGAKVDMRFDRPSAGRLGRRDILDPELPFRAIRPLAAGSSGPAGQPRMTANNLVGLTMGGLPGQPTPASPGVGPGDSAQILALPRPPFVRGSEFDPPMGGRVKLTLTVESHRDRATLGTAQPVARPVVSYRWNPTKPELSTQPDLDWHSLRSTSQIGLVSTPARGNTPRPVQGDDEILTPSGTPSLERVRLTGPAAQPASQPPLQASRMLPVSLDECTPKGGSATPVSRLESISPKPVHQLRKSTLKTQADWQRNKWSSASMYGSALWRIAIGRFSGALDQAPKGIRWVAAVAALMLGAFALFPGRAPVAPADSAWTMANNPGTPAAAAPAAVPPPPRRVNAPPPVRMATAKAARKQAAAEAASRDQGAGSSLSGAWESFQRRLSNRAAVAFTDDFRNGLAEWEGAGEWARSWSYDASGFVRTGGLALLAPGRDLTDYRMEFLGQIERRSMGWVVRASDLRNYYALKLTLVGDGPVPQVALIRYPVINGMAGAASQQILPIDVRADTVYRVQTEVRDDDYSVTVQGKVADSWSDARLKRGSIGLFSGKGELARVRWVGVWHQYDTLGRLCALLAPSGLPGRERGANQ